MSKQGRPTKYKTEFEEQVYKLCLLSATDVQIADFFEITKSTLYEWKLKYPKFSDAMREGKIKADTDVAKSLHGRAVGSKTVQQRAIKVKEPIFDENNKKIGDKEKIVVVDLIFEEPPDTKACEFWLRNRHSDSWREKQEVSVSTPELDEFKEAMEKIKIKNEVQ